MRDLATDPASDGAGLIDSPVPLHGFQGDRGPAPGRLGPAGLAVTVSREAGARGGTIGRRVARKLGWQVYDQELLEYMAGDGLARQALLDGLTPAAREWVEGRLQELLREGNLSGDPTVTQLARVVLALASAGEVVLIGRGAGSILPRETSLRVRVVAPLPERIAYMGQLMRLTPEEARERVRLRDERRNDFLAAHFNCRPGETLAYDLVLHSVSLGEEVCAELVAVAARARAAHLRAAGS